MKLSERDQKVVEIALGGGSPAAFLKAQGSKNPSAAWYNIKMKLKDNDPETYSKIQAIRLKSQEPTLADAMAGMKNAADEFFGKCEDMGLKLDKPEELKEMKPVIFDGFSVRGVEGEFGSYLFQEINGKQWIDYDNKDHSEELSMTVEQWRGFLAEIRKAALILGVEL